MGIIGNEHMAGQLQLLRITDLVFEVSHKTRLEIFEQSGLPVQELSFIWQALFFLEKTQSHRSLEQTQAQRRMDEYQRCVQSEGTSATSLDSD